MQSETNFTPRTPEKTCPVVMVEPGNIKIADLYNEAALEMGLELYFMTNDSSITSKYSSRVVIMKEAANPDSLFETIQKKIGREFHVFTESEIHLSLTRTMQMHPEYFGFWTQEQLIPRSKREMKNMFAEHAIPHARGIYIPSGQSEIPNLSLLGLQFPVVVKPEAGMSSCGVKKCYNENDLEPAIRNVRLFNQVVLRHHDSSGLGTLVEEFIDGREFAVDTCWQDGQAVTHFVLLRGPMDSDTFPDDLYYVDPHLSSELFLALTKTSKDCGKALQMQSGVTHTEMRLTKEGKIRVIETTPRAGAGGMFFILQSYRLGFNAARFSLQRFLKPHLIPEFSALSRTVSGHYSHGSAPEHSLFKDSFSNNTLLKNTLLKNTFMTFYQPIVQTKGKLQGINGLEKINSESYYLDYVRFVSDGTRWNGSDMNLRYSIWFLISTESEAAMYDAISHINSNVAMQWADR